MPTLFYRPNSNQTPIQMSYPSIANTGGTQYSFLAGPFIIYGGFIHNPSIGQSVTLSPGSALIYVDLTMAFVSASIYNFNSQVVPTSVSGTSFNITYVNPGSNIKDLYVYYLAIGLP